VRLRSALGNFGVNQERAVLAYGTRKFGQSLIASRDFSSGFISDRDYRNLSLTSMTHWKTSAGATDVTLAHNDRPFGADQFYGNFPSWERTKTWLGSIRQELGERTDASFGFRRHTDLFVLYRDRPDVFTNRHAVEGFQAAVRRSDPIGPNLKVFYGLEGYYDSIASTNLGNHDRGRAAGYVGVDARALKRFSLSAGVREEIYGRRESQVSPTVSGGYWVSSRFRLRASLSRAFRLPTFTDLYYHDPANVGSPDLRPERAWSYEGGADVYLAGNVRASLTVFHRRERDGIDYVRSSLADIWRATNFQKLNFTGVEAGVDATIATRHQIQLQYTGLNGAQAALGGLSKYSFNYPIHSGVASWTAALPGGMMARAQLGTLQRYARTPYALFDVYAARIRGRVHPFLQLTNITDTVYQEIFGVPMPGRAVVGGVEVVVLSRK
jgi:iron complex outermembrane receptor protein